MASRYGLRVMIVGAMFALCTMTTTASSTQYTDGGTASASAFDQYGYGFAIQFTDVLGSVVMPAAVEHRQIKRDFPVYVQPHARPIAIGAAVRPTSIAGWRSGRVRHLAAT